MLDLFTIFTKGGIVLWCFRGTNEMLVPSVNALIRSVILQERTGLNVFEYNNLAIQYKLDNEYDIIFAVAFQKLLQLSYLDKLLSDVHLEFRDKYKNELNSINRNSFNFDFSDDYRKILSGTEKWGQIQTKTSRQMKSYDESKKSKKTLASMVEKKGSKNQKEPEIKNAKIAEVETEEQLDTSCTSRENIIANRKKLLEKMSSKKSTKESKQDAKGNNEKGKKPRIWDLSGTNKDSYNLDRSKDTPEDVNIDVKAQQGIIGTMKGGIQDLTVEAEDINQSDQKNKTSKKGVFSIFKGLVGSKNLTRDDMQPFIEKFRDHLIGKNVAVDIAHKLCESVAMQLEGKALGTFDTVATIVKTTLTNALMHILSPKHRIDILRDVFEAKSNCRPYVVTFCGVNGVGKSTNLAKICFWMIENNFSVLIAACDTFRAGAVEQLKTHTRHLNALHPPEKHNGRVMVSIYEKGYGKDAAGIAGEAIKFAKDSSIDIVLIDTAGRMQDNEPLMRALAKLIKVNEPDLVLFVGEALVGNEAIDQLVKFNQALADYSASDNPHVIDGIVLTKFDTIDDKVGAAVSMTYITGQPIVFIGTGQTYTDLKAINAKAVVHALMK